MRPGHRLPHSSAMILALLLCSGSARASALQNPPETSPSQKRGNKGDASLKVCLRLADLSPFSGEASVRMMSSEGDDISGASTGIEGETIFSGLRPGNYTVGVSAAGFLSVRKEAQVQPGRHLETLFVIMTLKPLPGPLLAGTGSSQTPPASSGAEPTVSAVPASIPTPASSPAPTEPGSAIDPGAGHPARAEATSWIPAGLDGAAPSVEPDVECSLAQVTKGAGQRMEQFVDNLQKFSATERVEHFPVDKAGARRPPEVRNFEYVVMISQNSQGTFLLDEYRNGSVFPSQFQAGIATVGLPAMALLFHPALAVDFQFTCEGLGQWGGRPAWQVRFEQRPERVSRIRGYTIKDKNFPVAIKGRAWIDPGTFQVMRLETELVKPMKEIALTRELTFIEYGPVQFHTHNQQLWLPQAADLYVERMGSRYYRRHTFSNFKIFSVETAQNIQAPKESYSFKNMSDREIAGSLTVSSVSRININSVSITFTIPAGATVFKLVGPGKDISMPAETVGAATFVHDGPADSVKVDAYLVQETTLDVIPESSVTINP